MRFPMSYDWQKGHWIPLDSQWAIPLDSPWAGEKYDIPLDSQLAMAGEKYMIFY